LAKYNITWWFYVLVFLILIFSAPASPINPGFNIHYLIKNQIWKYPINTWFIYKMLDLEDTEVKTFMRAVNLGIKHWFSNLKVPTLDIEIKRSKLTISTQKFSGSFKPDCVNLWYFKLWLNCTFRVSYSFHIHHQVATI